MFKISDNIENLNQVMSAQRDYIEYEYKHMYMYKAGNMSVPRWIRAWTTDPDSHSSLTGEQRVVHNVYYGYKVFKDTKGNYQMVKSEAVDNLLDLPEGYDYITRNYCEVIYIDVKDYNNNLSGVSTKVMVK